MIASDKNDTVNSEADLIELNKKIVKLGEQFKKPVVATCDVHFMDPQDEIYRRIIMAGNGFSDADKSGPSLSSYHRRDAGGIFLSGK